MPLVLARRAGALQEAMDDPASSPAKLQRTYAQFARINGLFAAWRRVYTSFLRPVMRENAHTRLLDIGCGGGDIPLALWRWAAQDGLKLEVHAIDPDARALAYVRSRGFPAAIHFEQASSRDLVTRGEAYDLVISNHLLHHLSEEALSALLCDSEVLGKVALHNDIERGDLAYATFAVLTGPFFHHSFIVSDGLISIRRSYTCGELQKLAPPSWRVRRLFPYRLLLTRGL
jgi:2-polyprenyl-3-methyl-5-hydroxy-6-metoxy-1,4-benzoquinol methylase